MVGIDDSSDDDDDEAYRNRRKQMAKRRKIDGDNLEALGKSGFLFSDSRIGI